MLMIETLTELLHPLSIDEFVEKYRGKKSVYIPGTPEKVAGMVDKDSPNGGTAPRRA